MTDTVKLKHSYHERTKREHFYEGFADAYGGVITIPADHLHWVRRCWILGYNKTPEGNLLFNWQDVLNEIENQNKETPEVHEETTSPVRRRQSKA